MEIRIGTEADGEPIKGIDEVARVDKNREISIDRWLSHRECWVATVEGKVVAYAVFNYSFYERGFVELLYVAEGHRRQGIGAAFMAHLAALCDTTSLFTSTNQSNVPMQRLLLHAGFEASGVIENLDEGDPELVYFKLVDNAAV